jgi:hypothetical protein
MDADRAIAVIESVIAPKVLNHVQIEIIRGAIAGSSYQQIVDTTKIDVTQVKLDRESGSIVKPQLDRVESLQPERYKIGYIKEAAAQLWQLLSQKLGKKVTKKSLAALLLWYSKQSEPILNDDPGSFDLDGEGVFYGRTEELATLTEWCLVERCRLILLVGMGGMGKTRLAREIATHLNHRFDRTIWRSLLNAPAITELCTDLLQSLQPQLLLDLPTTVESQIELLIAYLKQDRCLLVLDNVESILAGQVQCGQYLPGYDGYDRLFRALGELPHQSCAILTSREKPHTIARSQIVNAQLVRSINIDGMTPTAAHQFVQSYGCPQLPAQMWQEVYAHYHGNPLALKIATIAAVEMTGGGEKMLELYPLMKQGKLQFQHIDDVLSRQIDRLSEIEQQLVHWLAISRKPITGNDLRANLVLSPHGSGEIINAFQSLSRRCITICQDGKWSIQPVMIAYLTRRLIDRFVAELSPHLPCSDIQNRFFYLNTYAMIQPQAKERVRQTQIQSILHPTLAQLLTVWSNHVDLSQQLQQISTTWQDLHPLPAGYLVENILNLLGELNP